MSARNREEIVGKRFLSVKSANKLKLSRISDWDWRGGVVRAVTQRDHFDPDVSVSPDPLPWLSYDVWVLFVLFVQFLWDLKRFITIFVSIYKVKVWVCTSWIIYSECVWAGKLWSLWYWARAPVVVGVGVCGRLHVLCALKLYHEVCGLNYFTLKVFNPIGWPLCGFTSFLLIIDCSLLPFSISLEFQFGYSSFTSIELISLLNIHPKSSFVIYHSLEINVIIDFERWTNSVACILFFIDHDGIKKVTQKYFSVLIHGVLPQASMHIHMKTF